MLETATGNIVIFEIPSYPFFYENYYRNQHVLIQKQHHSAMTREIPPPCTPPSCPLQAPMGLVVPPWMCSGLMSASTLAVVASSLSLVYRFRPTLAGDVQSKY